MWTWLGVVVLVGLLEEKTRIMAENPCRFDPDIGWNHESFI